MNKTISVKWTGQEKLIQIKRRKSRFSKAPTVADIKCKPMHEKPES